MILETERLWLRPFTLADAPRLAEAINHPQISAMTLSVPYPYTLADAEAYLPEIILKMQRGEEYTFALVEQGDTRLIGAVGLHLTPAHHRAEIGYWLAAAYWGRGYMPEAVRRVIRFGFDDLTLHKLTCSHYAVNSQSRRVIEKVGFRLEGTLRQHVLRQGEVHDLLTYGLLRTDLP